MAIIKHACKPTQKCYDCAHCGAWDKIQRLTYCDKLKITLDEDSFCDGYQWRGYAGTDVRRREEEWK